MSDTAFYHRLEPFRGFLEGAFNPAFYVPLPGDWLVAVADIVGSTRAVQAGKYAEVNYVGAACIVAVTNALPDLSLPASFGGDGATLALPPEAREEATRALLATRHWSLASFGLELRVGMVPMAELEKRGGEVQVAKMEASAGNMLAMFRGNGLDLADRLVKDGDGDQSFQVVEPEAGMEMPDLASLSCRWRPLPSENGTMLCLIVGALADTSAQSDAVYALVLRELDRLVDLHSSAASPVKLSNSRFGFRWSSIMREARSQRGPLWRNVVAAALLQATAWLIFRFRVPVGKFSPRRYHEELVVNSDSRRVSGMLKMVIDCTPQQSDAVEELLSQLRAQGKIVYGVHRADNALMTCVAPDAINHRHLHYIDGGDGGFWSAAKGLKAQMRE